MDAEVEVTTSRMNIPDAILVLLSKTVSNEFLGINPKLDSPSNDLDLDFKEGDKQIRKEEYDAVDEKG